MLDSKPILCRRPRSLHGFTLIELLVVVAIIVALLAILLPSMNQAIEAAQRAVCASNLHQTHVSLLEYGSGHFGALPPGQPELGETWGLYAIDYRSDLAAVRPGFGTYRQHGVLAGLGYIDAKVFYCPSWSEQTIVYDSIENGGAGPGGGWPSHGELDGTAQQWTQTNYFYRCVLDAPTYRSPRITDPTSTAIMADAFADPNRGVDYHHRVGYSVLDLGGAARFYDDPEHDVRDLNNGATFQDSSGGGYLLQEEVWRDYFGQS